MHAVSQFLQLSKTIILILVGKVSTLRNEAGPGRIRDWFQAGSSVTDLDLSWYS